jgi:hypothetical protein
MSILSLRDISPQAQARPIREGQQMVPNSAYLRPFGTDNDFDRQGPRIKLAPMGVAQASIN